MDDSTPCTFTNIIIHPRAHVNPPTELWTRCHSSQLQHNLRRPLPVFSQYSEAESLFQFIGCYRIVDWRTPSSCDEALQSFIRNCLPFHPETPDNTAGGEGWVNVVLEKVEDPILSAKPYHRYLMHYVFKIMTDNHYQPLPT